jgi:dTDP-4-dehydrorhamnose 3,5-epimerase
MKFGATTLSGVMLIDLEKRGDDRGYFARTFCAEEFARHGLVTTFVQVNHSHSARRGTLRGLHFQRAPHGEDKLIRVVRGAIHDVVLDLRPSSPSYGRAEGFHLSAENGRMVYVPAGCAHGFQTLEDDTDAIYQVSHPYTPAAEGGVRWNDPAFAIDWPLPVAVITEKDASWPDVALGGKAGL